LKVAYIIAGVLGIVALAGCGGGSSGHASTTTTLPFHDTAVDRAAQPFLTYVAQGNNSQAAQLLCLMDQANPSAVVAGIAAQIGGSAVIDPRFTEVSGATAVVLFYYGGSVNNRLNLPLHREGNTWQPCPQINLNGGGYQPTPAG
jgi:hypothetical protein